MSEQADWRSKLLSAKEYYSHKSYAKAEEIYQELIENTTDYSQRLVVLFNYGSFLVDTGRLDDAEFVLREALRIANVLRQEKEIIIAARKLGSLMSAKRDYQSAYELIVEAKDLSTKIGEFQLLHGLLKELAHINTHLARYDEAIYNLLQALEAGGIVFHSDARKHNLDKYEINMELGRVSQMRDDTRGAAAYRAAALATAELMGHEGYAKQARDLLMRAEGAISSPSKSERTVSVVFDPATARPEAVVEVLHALSDLYRALGGDGLVILDTGVIQTEGAR